VQRPEFNNIKDYTEFCKYYWYRDELIKICKAHGLKATGIFNERLKAAATLWKIVRESDMKKEYSHDLLEEYKHILL
jgi:hypothetical protein